jgi:hypothetical protein
MHCIREPAHDLFREEIILNWLVVEENIVPHCDPFLPGRKLYSDPLAAMRDIKDRFDRHRHQLVGNPMLAIGGCEGHRSFSIERQSSTTKHTVEVTSHATQAERSAQIPCDPGCADREVIPSRTAVIECAGEGSQAAGWTSKPDLDGNGVRETVDTHVAISRGTRGLAHPLRQRDCFSESFPKRPAMEIEFIIDSAAPALPKLNQH